MANPKPETYTPNPFTPRLCAPLTLNPKPYKPEASLNSTSRNPKPKSVDPSNPASPKAEIETVKPKILKSIEGLLHKTDLLLKRFPQSLVLHLRIKEPWDG